MTTEVGASATLLGSCLRPRETVRLVLDEDPVRHVALMAMLPGLIGGLALVAWKPGAAALVLAPMFVLVAAGLALAANGVFAWSLALVGRLFEGRARTTELRCALAWANAPLLAAPIVVALALVTDRGPHGAAPFVGAVAALAGAAIGLAWLRAIVVATSEAHAIGDGSALLAAALAVALPWFLAQALAFVLMCLVKEDYLADVVGSLW